MFSGKKIVGIIAASVATGSGVVYHQYRTHAYRNSTEKKCVEDGNAPCTGCLFTSLKKNTSPWSPEFDYYTFEHSRKE